MNIFQRQLDAKMASSLEEKLVKFSNKITNLTGIPAYKADEYGFTINTKHFEIKPMGYMWVNFFKDQSSSHDPNSSASHANAITEVFDMVGCSEQDNKDPDTPSLSDITAERDLLRDRAIAAFGAWSAFLLKNRQKLNAPLVGYSNGAIEIEYNADGEHIILGGQKDGTDYIIHLDKDGWNHLCVAIEDLKKFHVDKNI